MALSVTDLSQSALKQTELLQSFSEVQNLRVHLQQAQDEQERLKQALACFDSKPNLIDDLIETKQQQLQNFKLQLSDRLQLNETFNPQTLKSVELQLFKIQLQKTELLLELQNAQNDDEELNQLVQQKQETLIQQKKDLESGKNELKRWKKTLNEMETQRKKLQVGVDKDQAGRFFWATVLGFLVAGSFIVLGK
ncbi:Hypothetical_protein [Hexamita inflata]|uniref:Hypothetical_protein n=1 Tax=Hexamita inflata TaxID=28002 RepID=A0AA86Q7Q3_9EUKA|nr:Hypothetical protein HINF_LOCUS41331 [Hexamita inflata]